MRRIKLFAGLSVLFLTGVLVGALGLMIVLKVSADSFSANPKAKLPQKFFGMAISRMLDFDTEQKRLLMSELVQVREKIQRRKIYFQPKINEVIFDVVSTLEPTMSKEQKAKLRRRMLLQFERGRPAAIVALYRAVDASFTQIQAIDAVLAESYGLLDIEARDFDLAIKQHIHSQAAAIKAVLSEGQYGRLRDYVLTIESEIAQK